MKPIVPCSLVINTSITDLRLLSDTLPHIVSSHQCRFSETIIVVDERPLEGRLAQSSHVTDTEALSIESILDKVEDNARHVMVDYDRSKVDAIMRQWFGTRKVSIRCSAGTPIYAFLFGLEQAREDFRLHLDSDMLIYDSGPRSWVESAMEIIESVPEVMFAQQIMGTPHPGDHLHEFMAPFRSDLQLHVAHTFSTRCFLLKMSKLRTGFLPILPARRPWWSRWRDRVRGRTTYLPLEKMISRHLRSTKTYRCDVDRAYGFSLHAWNKHVFNDTTDVISIIRQVEAGIVPDPQYGQLNLLAEEYLANGHSRVSTNGGLCQ